MHKTLCFVRKKLQSRPFYGLVDRSVDCLFDQIVVFDGLVDRLIDCLLDRLCLMDYLTD